MTRIIQIHRSIFSLTGTAFFYFFILSVITQAQEKADFEWKDVQPKSGESYKTIYLELGGKFFPSLNYDIRTHNNIIYTYGLGVWNDKEEHPQWLFIPSFSMAYLFGRNKQFEAGAGTGPFIGTYSGMASVMIFSNLSYRYQRKEHFFFRAGINPFLGIPIGNKSRFMITPWIGLSFGYTL